MIEETLCPECNGPMVSRTGQYGVFWGCKAFPKCKGTRDSLGRSKNDRLQEKIKREMSEDTFEVDEESVPSERISFNRGK